MNTDPNPELTYIIIIGTFGTLLLAVSLVLFVISYQKRSLKNKLRLQQWETFHQQEIRKVSYQSEEKERERIVKDLHDDVGSLLSATKLQLNLMKMKVRNVPELAGLIEESIQTISDTIKEIRSISHNLRPFLLDSLGFSKAVEYLVQQVNNPPMLSAFFQESGEPILFDENKQINLYRSIQELINNAVKHSNACKLEITLTWNDHNLNIELFDNGDGFDYQKIINDKYIGLGLKNILSRLDIAEAKLKMESSENGTLAAIHMEFNSDNQNTSTHQT